MSGPTLDDRLLEVVQDLPQGFQIMWKRRYEPDLGLAEDSIVIWHDGNTKHRIAIGVNPFTKTMVPERTAPYGLVQILIENGWTLL